MQPEKRSPALRAPEQLEKAQEKIAHAIAQAGYDLNTNQNRRPVNAKSIGVMRKTLPKFEMSYEDLDTKIKNILPQIVHRGSDDNYELRVKKIKNGVDRLFRKDVLTPPAFLSHAQAEKIFNMLWNALNTKDTDDFLDDLKIFKLYGDVNGEEPSNILDAYEKNMEDDYYSRTFRQKKDFYNWLINRGPRQVTLVPGNPINKKALDKLSNYLDKYPKWEQPVSRTHDPELKDDDNYQDNWLSDFMQQYRRRWDEIQRIKNSNDTLYVEIVRQVVKDVKELVKAVDVPQEDGNTEWDSKDPSLNGTAHQSMTDGYDYFGLSGYDREEFLDSLVRIESEISSNFENVDVKPLKDRLQEFFSRSFDS